MSALVVESLEKKYGRKRVLANLSVEMTKNRFIVLLGANGAGKTTFLKVCAGLAPAGKGRVSLDGEHRRAARVQLASYVSEEGGFEPHKRIETILHDQKTLYVTFQHRRAWEMCKTAGLEEGAKWGALSKGQQHLLSLIVALAKPKPFIFIDELLANLDTAKKEAMVAVLTDFLVEEERMIIMATHAYEDVEMLADGVIFLREQGADVITDLEEWRLTKGQSLKDLFAEVGKR